jgi:uncharacterized protein YndB with AHSA1/START domain
MTGSVSSAVPDAATVVLTAHLDRPPTDAYAAFTDVAALATWFWPARLEPTYAVDAVVGGALRARSDVADFGVTATFRELVPDARLAMDWRWDGHEDATSVRIEFAASEDGTTLTLTHSANPTEAARDEHRQGWTDCLDRLVG